MKIKEKKYPASEILLRIWDVIIVVEVVVLIVLIVLSFQGFNVDLSYEWQQFKGQYFFLTLTVFVLLLLFWTCVGKEAFKIYLDIAKNTNQTNLLLESKQEIIFSKDE